MNKWQWTQIWRVKFELSNIWLFSRVYAMAESIIYSWGANKFLNKKKLLYKLTLTQQNYDLCSFMLLNYYASTVDGFSH